MKEIPALTMLIAALFTIAKVADINPGIYQ